MPLLIYPLVAMTGWIIGSTVNNSTEPSPIYQTPQESEHFSGIERIALLALGSFVLLKVMKKV